MNFSQFLLIIRAHLRIALFTLVVTLVGTFIISKLLPKTYKASTALILNYKGVDPVTGTTSPAQLLPGYMATQVDIITSSSVAAMVIAELKLDQSPYYIDRYNTESKGETMADWLTNELIRMLIVEPSKESSVVVIGYKGASPKEAADVSNAFANAYLKKSIELKVEPLKQAASYFNDQTKVLRENLDTAQKKLSLYQQKNGLVSVDNRLDVETQRLHDLSSQWVASQGQASEALSRQKLVQSDKAFESPDVAGNPMIQNLRIGLGSAESKLTEVAQRLGRNHPQYIGLKAEVDKLRAAMGEQLAVVSNSVSNNANILQRREGDIRGAMEKQKDKVLQLNRTRDEMSLLVKEVERAQRAYETTAQRFMQTNLEGQSNQSDISVLSPAVPPTEAASPKTRLNMIFSFMVGSMLAIGFALMAEMLDRRVRSRIDLEKMLDLPVLGELSWQPTKKKGRFSQFFRRSKKVKK